MRRSMTTLVALLGLVATASACAPAYDGFECSMVNHAPSGAVCSDRMLEVARGEALVVRVSPRSDSRTEYEDAEVELRPADPQLVDIRPGVDGAHTIIGLSLGSTSTEVWVDGELVDEVPTEVVPFRPSAAND